MAANFLDKIEDEKGQAIFELILFMPFLVYFATVLFNTGSAINGSINQQKATRGYFYYILKGNSMLPVKSDLNSLAAEGLQSVSAASIGWAERKAGTNEQYGTCYKYSTLYSSSDEKCEEKAKEAGSSIFVKPLTFYGVCSTTYILKDDSTYNWDQARGATSNCILGDGS
ncbi:MAG: hypothetical protein KC493_17465 [Bacteriovoracaceae bacterium]|nr:hypothetical protein [Bacteriovoracaceae bacterium]